MAKHRSRLKGILVVIASIMLAVTLCGVFYYFKVKQNENYQNQLHFRELQNISTSFNNGIGQLNNYTRLRIKYENKKRQINHSMTALVADIEQFHLNANTSLQALQELEFELESVFESAESDVKQDTKIYADIDEAERSLEAISGLKIRYRIELEALRDKEYRFEERFDQLLDSFNEGNQLGRFFGEHCSERKVNCLWLLNLFIGLERLYEKDYISDALLTSIESQQLEQAIEIDPTSIQRLDEQLVIHENAIAERIQQETQQQVNTLVKNFNGNVDKFIERTRLEAEALKEKVRKREANKPEQSPDESDKPMASNAMAPLQQVQPVSSQKVKRLDPLNESIAINTKVQNFAQMFRKDLKQAQSVLIQVINESIINRYHLSSRQMLVNNIDDKTELLANELNTHKANAKILAEQETKNIEELQAAIKKNNELAQSESEQIVVSMEKHLESIEGRLHEYELFNAKNALIKTSSKVLHQLRNIKRCLSRTIINRELCPDYQKLTTEFVGKLKSTKDIFIESGSALRRLSILNDLDTAFDSQSVFHHYANEQDYTANAILDYRDASINIQLSKSAYAKVPIEDISGEKSERYPLVLLVDQQGHKIASKMNPKKNASLVGLEFKQVQPILAKLLHQQHNGKKAATNEDEENTITTNSALGFSGTVDTIIAGVEYRLFISPLSILPAVELHSHNGVNGQQEAISRLYLIGFREKATLSAAKLSISRSLIIAGILLFAAVLALIPLLKLRFVSESQAFSTLDRHLAVLGLLFLIAIGTIASLDYWRYGKKKQEISETSKAIFGQMKTNFAHEVELLANYANKQLKIAQQEDNKFSRFKDLLFNSPLEDEEAQAHQDSHLWFLDNLFYLTAKNGSLEDSAKFDGIAYWPHAKFYRTEGDNISLASRNYAKKALTNELWSTQNFESDFEECSNGLYIERLFNLRDARLTTQFSRSCNRDDEKYNDVISYGTKLQTFFKAVLPEGFGYLVFDNAQGTVLYHSDDKRRSLVENIYVETDNNPLIKAIGNTPLDHNFPISFDSVYGGKMHNFTIGQLYAGVPWSLVVFYDKEALRSVNLITTTISLFICIIITLIIYCLLLLLRKRMRRILVWGQWYEQGEHYLKSKRIVIVIIGIALVVFCTYGVCKNIYMHIEHRYADFVNARLAQQVQNAINAQNNYRKEVIDTSLKQYGFSDKVPSLAVSNQSQTTIPCYLGGGRYEDHCVLIQPSSTRGHKEFIANQTDSFGLGFESIIEYIWSYSVLKSTIDENIAVVNKLAEVNWSCTQSKLPSIGCSQVDRNDNISRHKVEADKADNLAINTIDTITFWPITIALLVIILLAFMFKVVLVDWMLERLLGIDIPNHFRQLSQNKDNLLYHLKNGFFENHRFAQVIRANSAVQQALFFDPLVLKTLSPIGKRVINVAHWYQAPAVANLDAEFTQESGLSLMVDAGDNFNVIKQLTKNDSVESTINSLFSEHDVQWPLKEKRTLLLSGFENIANNPDSRQFALEVMDALMKEPLLNIIIFCELSPLYKLTKQSEYPSTSIEDNASPAEVICWSRLFTQFKKIYQWSAPAKLFLGEQKYLSPAQTLINELRSWPELHQLIDDFCQFHQASFRSGSLNHAQLSYYIKNYTSACRTDALSQVNQYWSSSQVVDFFSSYSGALYRFRWQLCTKAERLLLYQIANNFEPNPRNLAPIEHLTRRGYIYRDCGWHIINESFRQFILTAEPPEVMQRWLDEANENIWRYLRIPFFALLIAMLAIMVYSATDAIETAIGVLTGILGLIPLAIRNFTLFKGGS